jgi:hypothetical protein
MSRAPLVYADAERAAPVAGGYSVEAPTAGWYRYRLVAGGHPVAIRIWFGAPLDPVTGEELDRSHRWQATANGEAVDLDRVWPACGREPINATESAYLTGLAAWAQEHAPDSPQANPRKRIDLLNADTPLPF